MNFTTFEDIRSAGFSGFFPVKELQTSEQLRTIPDQRGLYMILRLSKSDPCFQPVGTFNGRTMPNPYDVTLLMNKWQKVSGSCVVYIGKAGSSPTEGATLRKRLKQYLLVRENHKGGRAIWQFSDPGELLVCWKAITDGSAKQQETTLIDKFVAQYGSFPLANWVR